MNSYSFWVNGEPAETLSLHDRGTQYGDGFFTTILISEAKIVNWQAHWRRIQQSCEALHIPQPEEKTLKLWIYSALSFYFTEHAMDSCVLKVVITRGSGGIGYQPPNAAHPNTLFYIKPAPQTAEVQATKISTGLCQTLASNNSFAGLKTLNRLENVIARHEMAEQGFDEGIMLNHQQQVICGTQSNLFFINDGKVITPKLDQCGIEGSTRFSLLKLLTEKGMNPVEEEVFLSDLENADEIFFTNAVRGVQLVSEFMQRNYQMEQGIQIHKLWHDWQSANAIELTEFRGNI